MKVAVLLASVSEPSKTRALADIVAQELVSKAAPGEVEVQWVSVYGLGTDLALATQRDELGPTAEEAMRIVEEADVLIAATPVFRASYPGMFKHFLDMIDIYALANKPTFLVATGGSDRHMLVVDQVLRPLFGYFQALVAPVGIYAASPDFDGTMLLNAEAYGRIEVAVTDMVPVLAARGLI